MKGFAGLCVTLGHVLVGYLNAGVFSEAEITLRVLRDLIYSFHMPLYFMISGRVYSQAYYTSEGLPNKRKLLLQIGNLTVVYVFFSLAYGFGKVVFGRFANNTISPKALFLIWMQPIDEFWYLYVLIAFYLLFYLLRPDRHNMLIVLGICFVFSLSSQFVSGPFQISNMLWYSFFFCIGAIYQGCERTTGNCIAAGGVFVAAVALLTFTWDSEKLAVVNFLIAFGMSAALWYVFKHVGFIGNNGVLQFCGRYSLELYIFHGFLQPVFRVVLPLIGVHGPYTSVMMNFACCTFFSLIPAWVLRELKLNGILFKSVSFFGKKHGL